MMVDLAIKLELADHSLDETSFMQLVINDKVKLEAKKPACGGFSFSSDFLKDSMGRGPANMTDT